MYGKFDEYKKFIAEIRKDHTNATVSHYIKSIDLFLTFFNITSISDIEAIDRDRMVEYRDGYLLTTKGVKIASANSYMRPVSVFLHWLNMGDKIPTVVTEKMKALKEPKTIPVFLTEHETVKLIDDCEDFQNRVMIALMLATGLRAIEVTKAKVSDISDQHIKVHGKGNKERSLWIEDEVYALLTEYLKTHKGEYLFTSKRGNHRISTTAVWQRVKKIAGSSNIDPAKADAIHPHSLRHTLTANLMSNGTDIRTAQVILGHENIGTTQRYAHIRDAVIDTALQNNNKIFTGRGAKKLQC